jgi:hypothetical protein
LQRLPFDITMNPIPRRSRMKYALLIYQDAEFDRFWAGASDEERAGMYAEFEKFAQVAGERIVGGHELGLSTTATTVRRSNGEVMVSDGPFAEVAEHLGGFYIVEADDSDAALEWASRVTAAIDVPIEVRPFAATAA